MGFGNRFQYGENSTETDYSIGKSAKSLSTVPPALLSQGRSGGGRDMDAGNVSVRLHGKGNIGAKPKGEVIADILASIKERRA
jgi:hypothetical protein